MYHRIFKQKSEISYKERDTFVYFFDIRIGIMINESELPTS